jgi:hypothetical protein
LREFNGNGGVSEDNLISTEFLATEGGLLNCLVRVEPFTNFHVRFQSDMFDDRLIWVINQQLNELHSGSLTTRECPPKFFILPSVFVNDNELDLGHTHGADITLLPWSRSPS